MANPFQFIKQNPLLNPRGISTMEGEYDLQGNFTPASQLSSQASTPQPTRNVLPQGSLQGSMTQPKTGSLTDFASVMRAVSKDVYDYRQKKEGKVTSKQFDPTKVSGSIFQQIMGAVESERGKDISKMYGSAVDAAKFDIQQKEEERKTRIAEKSQSLNDEAKRLEIIEKKVKLGIDAVDIPINIQPNGEPQLAYKNNNPGNLKFVGQAGATMGEGGFAKFNTPEDGFQALINQVQLDQSRGKTLAQFISDYAPPTENNTEQYIQQVSSKLGIDQNTPLSAIDAYSIAEQIALKDSSTKIIKGTGETEMTSGQITAFNSIVSNYNKSPLIAAADRTIILKNTIDEVKKDPKNAAQQLNLAYSYIQALDTYQSAVREGELSLVNSIGSKIQQYSSAIQKIQEGQIVHPDVALQIADAAQTIVDTISRGAKQKAQSYKSQAETVGLGRQWDKYVSGFQTGYNQTVSLRDPKTGEVRQFDNLTEEEIQEALNQGYIKI